MTAWTIVVPVKGTAAAKSRLGASPELALAIALDTVEAAVAVGDVVVVTVPALAPEFEAIGARAVPDPGDGLNSAILAGVDRAKQPGSGSGSGARGGVAVLLGDVPALRPSELAAALSAAERHPLAFVPDAEGTGTVLITAFAGETHSPAFGAGSRDAHNARGYVELALPAESGLRRDVDTREQLDGLRGRLGVRTSLMVR